MDAETSNKIATAVQIIRIDKLIEDERNKGNYEVFIPLSEKPQSLVNHYISQKYTLYWEGDNALIGKYSGIRITWYTNTSKNTAQNATKPEKETRTVISGNSAIIA
jgi:hypothetical protein